MKVTLAALLLCVVMVAQQAPVPANGAASPAPAGNNTSGNDFDKLAIAKQILVATGADAMVRQQVERMLPMMITLLRQNPKLPPAYINDFETGLRERYASIDVSQFAVPLYAQDFSLNELKEILAFFQSPTGRKIMRLQPQMTSEISTRATEYGKQLGEEVNREIIKAHPEYLEELKRRSSLAIPLLPRTTDPNEQALSSWSDKVYRAGEEGITPPTPIAKTSPEYTREAAEARIEGSVQLEVVVDRDGIPHVLRILKHLNPGLDANAIKAVNQWRFKPGTKGDSPVAVRVTTELNFKLLIGE